MGKGLVTYRDFGVPGELSTVTIPLAPITAANIVAQTTLFDTFRAAMGDIVLGGQESHSLVAWTNETKTPATDPYGQRENKWLVRYHEDTVQAEKHTMEIPTADLAKLDPNGNDMADMTAATVIAFVAAFEARVEVNARACVVDSIAFVSRKT